MRRAAENDEAYYLSSITIGELRRGVDRIRLRGDIVQAATLEAWLGAVLEDYAHRILPLDADAAQIWGRLRVPDPEPAIDKQIAAIALVNDLTLATRNARDFDVPGLSVVNPFSA